MPAAWQARFLVDHGATFMAGGTGKVKARRQWIPEPGVIACIGWIFRSKVKLNRMSY